MNTEVNTYLDSLPDTCIKVVKAREFTDQEAIDIPTYFNMCNPETVKYINGVWQVATFKESLMDRGRKLFHWLNIGAVSIINICQIKAWIELPLSWKDEQHSTETYLDENEIEQTRVITNEEFYKPLTNDTNCLVKVTDDFCPIELMTFVDLKPVNVYISGDKSFENKLKEYQYNDIDQL